MSAKKYRKKRKDMQMNALGNICFICKRKNLSKPLAHRKDGVKHKPFGSMKMDHLKESLASEDYVHVCYICHKAIHWCIKYLHTDWNDIICLMNNQRLYML